MPIGFLVVDDDNDDLSLFSEALEIVRPDANCYKSANGLAAVQYLDTLREQLPAIIFLDINMPVMNGWDCISIIKSTPGYQGIPVVIYTTSSTKSDKEKASAMGAACFISKMQDFKSLKKMLDIVIRNLENNSVDLICDDVNQMTGM
jgi:CheY-like chemotaxis protein